MNVALLAQDAHIPDPQRRGPARTVRRAYEDLVGPEAASRVPLSTFGLLNASDEYRPLGALSLGQRRLALATLLADSPDILLLDEPTNHLSLSLATALETALADYPGTVVIASHDLGLRSRWTGNHDALATANAGRRSRRLPPWDPVPEVGPQQGVEPQDAGALSRSGLEH
jgi:macrolide transport system ATP-binding/permease protein